MISVISLHIFDFFFQKAMVQYTSGPLVEPLKPLETFNLVVIL